VLHRLESDPNVWIATGGPDGVPHLVPLSLAWSGEQILVATPTDSVTVRNASATGAVRAALDSADDVVIVDATAEAIALGDADPDTMRAFVDRVGWDPGAESGEWSLVVLSPTRIQAWRNVGEIEGRTVMRDGNWID